MDIRLFLMASTAALLAACSQGETDDDSAAADSMDEIDATAMGEMTDCPVIESSNWRAYIDKMPGPDARAQLTISGDLTTPTPGYEFDWKEGPADRSAIPTARFSLVVTAPEGMVAQVLDTQAVTYRTDAIAEQYRAIIVMCGEEVLAEIEDIETVQ